MKKSLFPGGNRDFFAYKHNGIKAFAIEIGIYCTVSKINWLNLFANIGGIL